jgi:hypothetical protein
MPYFLRMNQEGTWERRGSFVYYAELLFELTALCFDFIHHLHMLVGGAHAHYRRTAWGVLNGKRRRRWPQAASPMGRPPLKRM